MAAKFDKELLKKHHFWFLFIPIGILMIVVWYGLNFEIPEEIEATQKKYDEKAKEQKKQGTPLPRKALEELDKQLRELDVQRVRMWKEGWGEQKDLYTWPTGYVPEQLRVFSPLRFGDEIPEKPLAIRDQFRDNKVYANEYRNLVTTIEPIQFRDRWEKVLNYREDWGRVPSSEDMWLAMEDYWVQRELLLAIHRVNVSAARFTRVTGGADAPLHRQFKSRLWEIDLEVVNQKDNKQIVKGKLKNVSGRLQVMGIGNIMRLRVMLSGDPFILEAEGEPVENDKTIDIYTVDKSKHTIKKGRVSEIESVEQLFDARTAPVKRIEFMGMFRMSDRNKDLPLKMSRFSGVQAKKDADALPAGTAPVALPPPPAAEGEPEPAAVVTATNLPPLSQNKFVRNRYIDVTDQIRRLPFGLVLTTDQTFMKDILESILAIKLRPQFTQLDWIRFHDTLEYGAGLADPARKRDGPNNNRDDQFSANLMELSIYGIVTLFERTPEDRGSPAKQPTAVKDAKDAKK